MKYTDEQYELIFTMFNWLKETRFKTSSMDKLKRRRIKLVRSKMCELLDIKPRKFDCMMKKIRDRIDIDSQSM